MNALEQRMNALQGANRVRVAQADLKRELSAGALTLAQALDDPRATGMALFKLLEAQFRWGSHRTMVMHRKTGIDSRQPIDRLTERQKARIASLA